VAGSCDTDNELPDSIKDGAFSDEMCGYQLLNKDFYSLELV
jgi:hypothetical protein